MFVFVVCFFEFVSCTCTFCLFFWEPFIVAIYSSHWPDNTWYHVSDSVGWFYVAQFHLFSHYYRDWATFWTEEAKSRACQQRERSRPSLFWLHYQTQLAKYHSLYYQHSYSKLYCTSFSWAWQVGNPLCKIYHNVLPAAEMASCSFYVSSQ